MPVLGGPMLAAALVMLVCACGSAGPAATASHTASLPGSTGTDLPTPAPTAPPADVRVVAAAAAASPTGVDVFVVVHNGGGGVTQVHVHATLQDTHHAAPQQADVVIGGLAPDESQAVEMPVAIPSNFAVSRVDATVSAGGNATYTNPLTAEQASFMPDPISPSIAVTVRSPVAVASATVIGVCWSGSTLVGGASQNHVAINPGAQTVTMPATLSATPTSCTGYARSD